jgi:streptogramin lyase
MRTSTSTLRSRLVAALAIVGLVVLVPATIAPPAIAATKTRLVTGLAGGSGSTVGPDGALYVTEGLAGRVSRVDPQTGSVTTYASGLPPSIIGIGGAMDVVFKGGTAYVLVTLVGPDVGAMSTASTALTTRRTSP